MWGVAKRLPEPVFAGVQGESREMNSRPILGAEGPERLRMELEGSQAKGKLQSCQPKGEVPADWPQAFGFQGHWGF